MSNDNLQALSDAGVSIWLDDLSRDRLDSGNLAELVKVRNVVGVTTNPSIFQAAMSIGTAYDDQLAKLAKAGKNVDVITSMSFSNATSATPDLVVCVTAPPSSSCVTTSLVTVLTTSGPVTNI